MGISTNVHKVDPASVKVNVYGEALEILIYDSEGQRYDVTYHLDDPEEVEKFLENLLFSVFTTLKLHVRIRGRDGT